MRQLIEFPLEDGGSILVEIDAPEPKSGIVQASSGGKLVTKASDTFANAMKIVQPAASSIIEKLRDLGDPPDEISVEFGLKLTAEAGAYVASVGTEANYKVSLIWKQDNPSK